ncbi:MAG: OmpH family outer membrane protein [Bacteroidia bacterium]|nr:OmpH family outer membrane protein [Bacteroidia bacterium]NND09813.1 OmpH family outer membrane protein [Flavobacteriaceae bacterium]MBT8309893.1 OmpH family outer membrane protein [Bacteroidia bacterium]NNK29037.1 OmpH family outer membrane protein [Flavobacteriaceae bacterium]NNL59768.1 OmpH family outer membrane protein [Flavobacteriaceae bacterium]
MKRFKTLLLATALFIGMTSFMQAQSNVAHINTQELIQAMPEMMTAQAEIEKLGKTYEAEIKELATSLQNKMKQYDTEAPTQTDEENQKRVQEVQGLEQNIRSYQANAQKDLQQKEFDLLKPITEKAKAAIDKVAKAQGFQYVLDAATLIVADGKDLMADVKAELGI